MKPRILVLAPSFAPAIRAGGPARVLTNMVSELCDHYEFTVVTADRDLGSASPFAESAVFPARRGSARVYYINPRSVRQLFRLRRQLRQGEFDLIMLNSIWNVPFSFLPALFILATRPHGKVLLMPRGELEQGAMALKSLKKALLFPLVKAVYRRAVDVFGATSDSEAANIKTLIAPVEVVITANDHPDRIETSAAVVRSPGPIVVTFLGRIHPTKGLLELLDGVGQCKTPLLLNVAGPIGDANYWKKCAALVEQLPAHVSVRVLGLLDREEVPELLRSSDLLAMLTAGENYGHVVAEALQCGCSVLITKETPWTAVVRNGGGEVIADRSDAQQVAAVLDRWATMSVPDLRRRRLMAVEAFDSSGMHSAPNIIELVI